MNFFEQNCSFLWAKEKNEWFAQKKRVTHSFVLLCWVTWANHSGRSFILSNLSKTLTFAHLSWAIWVNERMSDEQMSKLPTLIIKKKLIFSQLTLFVCEKSLKVHYRVRPINPSLFLRAMTTLFCRLFLLKFSQLVEYCII